MTEKMKNLITAIRDQASTGVILSEVEMVDLVLMADYIEKCDNRIVEIKLDNAALRCKLNKAVRSNITKLRSYK